MLKFWKRLGKGYISIMSHTSNKSVLALAGYDSSLGAGISVDAAVLAALGCRCRIIVTADTRQTSQAVNSLGLLPVDQIVQEVEDALQDPDLGAIKIGMLGSLDLIRALVKILPKNIPVILDPILFASSGGKLFNAETEEYCRALTDLLFPCATLLTPNLNELNLAGVIALKSEACEVAANAAGHASTPWPIC